MKLHFLGTCAGTEPIETRKHASVALELDGHFYWLDAGEGCSRTAHLMGIDLLKISAIFISHTHMDHVGGLANLLWNIRKLSIVKNFIPDDIELYIPNQDTLDGVFKLLKNSEGGFKKDFEINCHAVKDGVLFDNGNIKITASHNEHIAQNEQWLSYSYLIEAENKRIVYSGDVKSYSELDDLIGDYCDAVIIETGHFGIDGAYEYLKAKNIDKIFFSHNGREIINFPKESQEKVEHYFKGRGIICEDAMTIELSGKDFIYENSIDM